MVGLAPAVAINSGFAQKYAVPDDKRGVSSVTDARALVPSLRISGNYATFTGFDKTENTSKDMDRIDFIFGARDSGWYVIYSAYVYGYD